MIIYTPPLCVCPPHTPRGGQKAPRAGGVAEGGVWQREGKSTEPRINHMTDAGTDPTPDTTLALPLILAARPVPGQPAPAIRLRQGLKLLLRRFQIVASWQHDIASASDSEALEVALATEPLALPENSMAGRSRGDKGRIVLPRRARPTENPKLEDQNG